MPPLQPASSFELAAAIPFADRTPSPFDKIFDTQVSVRQPSTTTHSNTRPMYQTSTSNTPVPSEADISALFGLAAPAAQQHVVSTPVPPAPQDRSYRVQQYQTPAKPTQHRYPTHNASSYRMAPPSQSQSQSQSQEHNDHQGQHQQHSHQHQYQQHTPYQQYNPNQFNVNGYSVVTTDYSCPYDHDRTGSTMSVADLPSKASQPARNSMAPNDSSGFFSRFGVSDNSSAELSTERQGIFAPKLAKAAASYVSNTLAATSTFASEKLSNASTKIADLWQHNQHVLPQEQEQKNQQGILYHHGNYCSSNIASTMHETSHQPSVDQRVYSYDEPAQLLNANNNGPSNYHYQSSFHNSYNNSEHDTTICGTGNALATSTLSNAATVAGSYLPSLSKLPALPSLRGLPALPSLPWTSKDKNQLPCSQSQHHQWNHQSVNEYIAPADQAQAYHTEQHSSYLGHHDSQNNSYSPAGNVWTSTGVWWGLRDEMHKGRRMVETGVQAGVAWWWDSDVKNPLGNVV